MAYEPTEDEFAYWGNEGESTDQTELILALSEQVAELQTRVEEQGAIIDELSENVAYKEGAVKPTVRFGTRKGGFGGRGIGRMARIPMMRPKGIAKMGVRMGAQQVLSRLGYKIPFLGLIIGAVFMTYEWVMKDIANTAAMNAVREHEKKDVEARRQIYAEMLEAVEKERRELYRSVEP